MHMEILARLSEIHRQKAAEVAALDQQRTALMHEIAELTTRREAEAAMLKELQRQRSAEAERLRTLRQAITSDTLRSPSPAAEPPSGGVSAPQEPPAATQSVSEGTARKRVFVHYAPNREKARVVAERVAHQLGQNGYPVPDIRGVSVQLSSPAVRYFFLDDRSATEMVSEIVAASLREEGLGPARVRVQDFTRSPTKPIRGTLEVWIQLE